jgi:hypothetical protein
MNPAYQSWLKPPSSCLSGVCAVCRKEIQKGAHAARRAHSTCSKAGSLPHLRGMNAVVHHMLDCTGFALFRQGISLFFPCFYADFDGF